MSCYITLPRSPKRVFSFFSTISTFKAYCSSHWNLYRFLSNIIEKMKYHRRKDEMFNKSSENIKEVQQISLKFRSQMFRKHHRSSDHRSTESIIEVQKVSLKFRPYKYTPDVLVGSLLLIFLVFCVLCFLFVCLHSVSFVQC